jgi:hypothetical protein
LLGHFTSNAPPQHIGRELKPIFSGTFGCDDGCPGTYNMKLRVCELECDDSKHAGHSGAFIQRLASAAATAAQCHLLFVLSLQLRYTLKLRLAVLDINDSLTFDIRDE